MEPARSRSTSLQQERSSAQDAALSGPWLRRSAHITQVAAGDDRSSWICRSSIRQASTSQVARSQWWQWRNSSERTECGSRGDDLANSGRSTDRVQSQKVLTMRNGQHAGKQIGNGVWCQPKSWSPFLMETSGTGHLSPPLSRLGQPLPASVQPQSSSASAWSLSPSSSSASSSPEKRDFREAQVNWDIYGARIQAWPSHHQINKVWGEKEPDLSDCGIGSSLEANLERNIRWLTNSQLNPDPPSRLSGPQSSQRRRPILSSVPIARIQPSYQQISCLRAVSPSPASSSTQLFHQRQQRTMGSKTTTDAKICTFCWKNGETQEFYTTHKVKDCWGRVICPVLRAYVCPNCGLSGDNAHTVRHCPYNQ